MQGVILKLSLNTADSDAQVRLVLNMLRQRFSWPVVVGVDPVGDHSFGVWQASSCASQSSVLFNWCSSHLTCLNSGSSTCNMSVSLRREDSFDLTLSEF